MFDKRLVTSARAEIPTGGHAISGEAGGTEVEREHDGLIVRELEAVHAEIENVMREMASLAYAIGPILQQEGTKSDMPAARPTSYHEPVVDVSENESQVAQRLCDAARLIREAALSLEGIRFRVQL